MKCEAKIRPFINETELDCNEPGDRHAQHCGVLLDYAYPGSETKLTWFENDRRTFRGAWTDCDQSTCVLPAGHRGNHSL